MVKQPASASLTSDPSRPASPDKCWTASNFKRSPRSLALMSVLELCTSKSLSVSVLPLGTGMPIRRAV
jgi:hypothetical protein